MLASELKFLAEVADLARLDFEAASINLAFDENRLVARYSGAYSSGQRWLSGNVPQLAASVSCLQFKQLVGLFDEDAEVVLSEDGPTLVMESTKNNANKSIKVQTRGPAEGIEPMGPIGEEVAFEVEVSTLLREVEMAAEFAARSMAKPVLTGLRLGAGKGLVQIQASDGISSLFETFIKAKTGSGIIDIIVPAHDLVLGLKLIKDGVVKVVKPVDRSNIVLYGESAMFRCSLLAGKWPDFSKVKDRYPRQTVQIPTHLVRSLVAGVRIFGTSNDLQLRGDGENLFLESMEGEAGRFSASIPSELNGVFVYDVGNFLLAMGIGSELRFEVAAEGKVPTFVQNIVREDGKPVLGNRKYWIAQKS